jgi:hypothetical protein
MSCQEYANFNHRFYIRGFRKELHMRLNPAWIAALGLLSVTVLASGAAIQCSGGAQVFTIPEDSTEASTVLTCPGFNVSNASVGTAVFLDPGGTVVSDFVVLANVGTAVQFTFVSDLDTGPALVPPLPIIQTVTEPTPFIVVGTSTTGSRLQFTFTSDVNESPTGPSETIQVAPIPEPATLTFAGIGGLLLIVGFYLRRRCRA